MNPIIALDIASVVLSFVVFHLAYKVQSKFGKLVRSAFVIFYGIGIMVCAIALLEFRGGIIPEPSASNLSMRVVVLAILVLIVFGLAKIGHSLMFQKGAIGEVGQPKRP